MKRTVQVNVKITEEDFTMLRKAAEKKWPDAVMTNSGIVLALARIAAQGERLKSAGVLLHRRDTAQAQVEAIVLGARQIYG